jgi:redox-sensitive bicupin YhaK (pirin superfamily)
LKVPKLHNALVYLISGKAKINNEILEVDYNQFVQFNNDGEGFYLEGVTQSRLLVLSGLPLNETVKTYGPFVMNTQSELIEAMNDYQDGKMGYLES